MRCRLFIGFVFVLVFLVACQGTPPTLMVLVVTATLPSASGTEDIGGTTVPAITATPSRIPPSETPAPTPTLDPFPTATMGQIQVAEQPFEHGRMFWIQPLKQIWVIIVTGEGHGTWTIYQDTFEDGEPEFDPSITPPDDNLYQPERGFGKLWRENDDVRRELGWAVTPTEFGYISRYEYHPGGQVNTAGQYNAGPGYRRHFDLFCVPVPV